MLTYVKARQECKCIICKCGYFFFFFDVNLRFVVELYNFVNSCI